jgi:protein gp37
MGANTKIEWATHTFNPWIGCTKVSPACTNCYAERDMSNKKNGVIWGAGNPRQRTTPANWNKPVQWNKNAGYDYINWQDEINLGKDLGQFNRQRVFCASLSDVFDSEVPDIWRHELFGLIDNCKNLDWLLLTKRPENCASMLPPKWIEHPPVNMWLGTSVENQSYAEKRIPELLKVPAAVHFISCEPLLSDIDISKLYNGNKYILDWIIAGGESGPDARPMNPKWVRSLRDQSNANNIKFLFKQWGEWGPASNASDDVERVGKVAAGRILNGRTWDEYPESRLK